MEPTKKKSVKTQSENTQNNQQEFADFWQDFIKGEQADIFFGKGRFQEKSKLIRTILNRYPQQFWTLYHDVLCYELMNLYHQEQFAAPLIWQDWQEQNTHLVLALHERPEIYTKVSEVRSWWVKSTTFFQQTGEDYSVSGEKLLGYKNFSDGNCNFLIVGRLPYDGQTPYTDQAEMRPGFVVLHYNKHNPNILLQQSGHTKDLWVLQAEQSLCSQAPFFVSAQVWEQWELLYSIWNDYFLYLLVQQTNAQTKVFLKNNPAAADFSFPSMSEQFSLPLIASNVYSEFFAGLGSIEKMWKTKNKMIFRLLDQKTDHDSEQMVTAGAPNIAAKTTTDWQIKLIKALSAVYLHGQADSFFTTTANLLGSPFYQYFYVQAEQTKAILRMERPGKKIADCWSLFNLFSDHQHFENFIQTTAKIFNYQPELPELRFVHLELRELLADFYLVADILNKLAKQPAEEAPLKNLQKPPMTDLLDAMPTQKWWEAFSFAYFLFHWAEQTFQTEKRARNQKKIKRSTLAEWKKYNKAEYENLLFLYYTAEQILPVYKNRITKVEQPFSYRYPFD